MVTYSIEQTRSAIRSLRLHARRAALVPRCRLEHASPQLRAYRASLGNTAAISRSRRQSLCMLAATVDQIITRARADGLLNPYDDLRPCPSGRPRKRPLGARS